MKILFYGDPHGRYKPLFDAVMQYQPEAVIVLGDFMLSMPMEKQLVPILDKTEFWFIHGNHDTDSDEYYRFMFESELSHRNLHGRVEVIAGIRVAGLGGVFRGKVWHPDLLEGKPVWQDPNQYLQSQSPAIQRVANKYGGLPRQHNSSIWFNDYERLFDQDADILVTHEAPSCHRHGFSTLDELAVAMNVKQIFHGHHHENYCDHLYAGITSIDVHGVGLANCKDEKGNLLYVQ